MCIRCVLKIAFLAGVFLFFSFAGINCASAQNTVRLLNLNAPNTRYEVGNQFRVSIRGAARSAPVTFRLRRDGGPLEGPFDLGKSTDGFGNLDHDGQFSALASAPAY
jgi:hypothetical protein